MLEEAIKRALTAARMAARSDYLGFPRQGDGEIKEATRQLADAIHEAIDPRSADDE